ncbi:hypothetical protein VTO42DRAFT_9046 [Malbranchea cinnamomea]
MDNSPAILHNRTGGNASKKRPHKAKWTKRKNTTRYSAHKLSDPALEINQPYNRTLESGPHGITDGNFQLHHPHLDAPPFPQTCGRVNCATCYPQQPSHSDYPYSEVQSYYENGYADGAFWQDYQLPLNRDYEPHHAPFHPRQPQTYTPGMYDQSELNNDTQFGYSDYNEEPLSSVPRKQSRLRPEAPEFVPGRAPKNGSVEYGWPSQRQETRQSNGPLIVGKVTK